MSQFFDKFPLLLYDVTGKRLSNYELSTNIFFRIRIIREILGNISAYYEYLISDSDTPEILADKLYGNPEAHWLILMANDIVDPQYDWPLNYNNFNNYVIGKYGSAANAKTQIHHYEKVVTREEQLTGIVTETRFTIDYDTKTNTIIKLSSANGNYTVGNTVYISSDNTITNATVTGTVLSWSNTTNEISIGNLVKSPSVTLLYQTLLESNSNVSSIISSFIVPTVPYDYYLGLPASQEVNTYNLENGRTVVEIISRDAITSYDYENQENEKKRSIKIIKPEYYGQILREFEDLTSSKPSYIRKLV